MFKTNNINMPDQYNQYDAKAKNFINTGGYEEAIRCYNKALEIKLQAYGETPNNPDILNSYNNLAKAYINIGNHEKGEEFLKKASTLMKTSEPYSEIPLPEVTDYKDVHNTNINDSNNIDFIGGTKNIEQ